MKGKISGLAQNKNGVSLISGVIFSVLGHTFRKANTVSELNNQLAYVISLAFFRVRCN